MTILILCGHGAAHGGWGVGARYLVIIMPLMLDPIFNGEMKDTNAAVKGVLFGLSFVLSTLAIFTFPFAPPEFQFPHNDFWMAFIRQEGWIVPNFANVLGATSSFWTLVPVVLALAGVLVLVVRNAVKPTRFLAGSAVAVVAVGVYVSAANLSGQDAKFRRASIAERYFRPAGRLDAFSADPVFASRVNEFK